MALLAGCGESLMRYWSYCRVVVVLMATHAGGAGDVVVVVDVAVGALPRWNSVRSSQGKSGLGVIERCRLPGSRVVAGIAGLRKTSSHVVGVRGVLEIGQMARDACRAGQVVVVIDVTVRTLPRRNRMRAGQSEIDHGMIEGSWRPGDRGVTLCAIGGKICRDVVGIHRALKIFQVAIDTGCAGQVENVVGMAVSALARRYRVPSGQRKPNRRVIEFRAHPVVGSVAGIARSRELGGDVVRTDRGLKICEVAGRAGRRHRLEFAIGRTLVAGIAVHGGVCSGQWEAVIVLLDLLNRDLPSSNRVTLFAVRSQLSLVDVGVAILASLANIVEHGLDVALCAGHGLVHAAQGISRLVVIELRNCADRSPGGRSVAVLARDIQIPVWAVGPTRNLRARSSPHPRESQQEHSD